VTTKFDVLSRRVVLGCALVASLISVPNVLGQEKSGTKLKPVVAVPPFENQSKRHHDVDYEVSSGNNANLPKRRYVVDRLTEAPRSVLENMLGNIAGVTVVERQQADELLIESDFGGLTDPIDSEKAIKLGKRLRANLIVMGTITDLHDDVVAYKGYGIRTENIKVVCEIRVRLLDVETGKVRFSKIVKGSQTYSKSNFGGKLSSDRNFAAVEAALAQLAGDSQFEAAILGRKPGATDADGLVEVEFAPKPENCDIEINGKYVGGSPLKKRLPVGKELKIRITKDGYKDWDGVIVPEKGLRITRGLGLIR
jgi:curli biogenesis system outer membrane secretion channel CsgG